MKHSFKCSKDSQNLQAKPIMGHVRMAVIIIVTATTMFMVLSS